MARPRVLITGFGPFPGVPDNPSSWLAEALAAGAAAQADAELHARVLPTEWQAVTFMPDLYAAADLVVLPSRVEGLPSVILEAFAASRAVVATAVGGVAEALRDGEEGRLVPARSPEALRAAIVEIASDRELRRAMGERGRRRAFEAFHVRDATRRLEAVYERWTVGASCAGAA